MDYLVGHSGICLAVGAQPHIRTLHDAVARQTDPCAVAADDGELAVPAAPGRNPTPPARNQTPDARTECALLYTSGTTGKPKGCVLSNDYFLRCGRWYTEIGGLCAFAPATSG